MFRILKIFFKYSYYIFGIVITFLYNFDVDVMDQAHGIEMTKDKIIRRYLLII
jgi:hypothetical protein